MWRGCCWRGWRIRSEVGVRVVLGGGAGVSGGERSAGGQLGMLRSCSMGGGRVCSGLVCICPAKVLRCPQVSSGVPVPLPLPPLTRLASRRCTVECKYRNMYRSVYRDVYLSVYHIVYLTMYHNVYRSMYRTVYRIVYRIVYHMQY